MSDGNWWVSVTGTAEGPYGPHEIAAQHAQGRVVATTPVWRDGMTEWLPAGETELVNLLTAGPRPATPPPVATGGPPPPASSGAAQAWTAPPGSWSANAPADVPFAHTWQSAPPPSWGRATPQAAGNGLSTAAIVCGVIAILFIPIVLGPAGIICAGKAKSRGEPWAGVGMAIAVGGMVLGFIIGAVVGVSSFTA